MNRRLFFVIASVILVTAAAVFLHKPRERHPAFHSLLVRLAWECAPSNPEADYAWSTMAMPTEKKRERLIAEFRREGRALLPDVQAGINDAASGELREMLIVIAAVLGDKEFVPAACRTMVWSSHPAVRLCAARELRRLRDPRSIDWFERALHDDRFVHNSDCQRVTENYYPIRVVAELALRDMGITMTETALQ